jgi:WD40 repeat protein
MASPETIVRFEQEAQALGRLQHPGIAQIYEAGTANTGFGPQPYFAMELIHGLPPREFVARHKLGVRERLELVAKTAEAVHHAHQRGLIHRDLKPGNILVDESGQPKVLDFGVARAIDNSEAQQTRQTDVGQLVGTLAYMSPEQVLVDPHEIDTRTDVYALGIILYELIAERLPYNASRKLHEAIKAISEEDPVMLGTLDRTCKGDIETITAKALEKDKTRRYTSAAELAADIRRYLTDQPIIARPPTAAYQLHKFARRNRALVAGTAAVFAVLVAGVIVSSSQATRAARAERAALLQRDRITWQNLSRESVRLSAARTDDDLAALLARQAFLMQQREPNPYHSEFVENALQQAGSLTLWSHNITQNYRRGSPALTVSADGSRAAAAGPDGSILLWDMKQRGSPPRILKRPGLGPVLFLAFSPDGSRLASGGFEDSIWDLRESNPSPVLLRGHKRDITGGAFSPDGTTLVTTDTETILLWDLRNRGNPGQPIEPVLLGSLSSFVAFSPDGAKLVAVGGPKETGRIWDIRNPDRPSTEVFGLQEGLTAAFSPDGHFLALGTDGNLMNMDEPTAARALAAVSDREIELLLGKPNGNDFTIFDGAAPLSLFDLQNRTLHRVLLKAGGVQRVTATAFSSDGKRLAAGSFDYSTGIVRIWDMGDLMAPPLQLRGHQAAVRSLAFSLDGTVLFSASDDGIVRAWDLQSPAMNRVLPPPQGPRGNGVRSLAFGPEGNRLLAARSDGSVHMWDLQNMERSSVVLEGNVDSVLRTTALPIDSLFGTKLPVVVVPAQTVALSTDASRLAVGGGTDGREPRVWDLKNPGAPPKVIPVGNTRINALRFSPDASELAMRTQGKLLLWNLRTSAMRVFTLPGDSMDLFFPFSLAGTHLAASTESSLSVWDLRDSKLPPVLLQAEQRRRFPLALSPDGRTLAASTENAILWNLLDLKVPPVVLRGAGSPPIQEMVFSRDGTRLATTANQFIRLWDLLNLNQSPVSLEISEYAFGHLAFSPDGSRLAARQSTDDIHLFQLGDAAAAYLCTRVWRNLSMDEWRLYIGDGIPYERTCPALPDGHGAPTRD